MIKTAYRFVEKAQATSDSQIQVGFLCLCCDYVTYSIMIIGCCFNTTLMTQAFQMWLRFHVCISWNTQELPLIPRNIKFDSEILQERCWYHLWIECNANANAVDISWLVKTILAMGRLLAGWWLMMIGDDDDDDWWLWWLMILHRWHLPLPTHSSRPGPYFTPFFLVTPVLSPLQ